jgi:hypothetical protein
MQTSPPTHLDNASHGFSTPKHGQLSANYTAACKMPAASFESNFNHASRELENFHHPEIEIMAEGFL